MRARSGGFTLIEMMIAMAVVTVVITGFLYVLMSAHAANTSLAASMTANAVLRAQEEEAVAAAAAGASTLGAARALVVYYGTIAPLGSTEDDESLPIGPNGDRVPMVRLENSNNELVYRFAVPEPGDFHRKTKNAAGGYDRVFYDRGIGEMRIYLNESAIPPKRVVQGSFAPSGAVTTNAAGNTISWTQLGENPGATDDGELRDAAEDVFTGTVDADALKNPPEELTRVFADITVTYYADPAHTRRLSLNERRVLVTGSADESALASVYH